MFGYRINLDEIELFIKNKFSLESVILNKDDFLVLLTDKKIKNTDLIINYINSLTKINKKFIKIIKIDKLPLNQSGKISYEKAHSIKI